MCSKSSIYKEKKNIAKQCMSGPELCPDLTVGRLADRTLQVRGRPRRPSNSLLDLIVGLVDWVIDRDLSPNSLLNLRVGPVDREVDRQHEVFFSVYNSRPADNRYVDRSPDRPILCQ